MKKYYFYNDKLIQKIRKIIKKYNNSNKERNMIVVVENKNNTASILTNEHINRDAAMFLLISTLCNILYHEKADFVTLEMVAEQCRKIILYVLEEIQRQEERQ